MREEPVKILYITQEINPYIKETEIAKDALLCLVLDI